MNTRLRLLPLLLLAVSPAHADVPDVQAWAYQLQNAAPDTIAGNSTFDLMVMDQSLIGGPEGNYTPAEIAIIIASGKIAVCYLSIGEAENYRWYWQPEWDTNPPSWLGPENPDWPGNQASMDLITGQFYERDADYFANTILFVSQNEPAFRR